MQRKRDRALALEPKAVTSYVQREVKAGKVPSTRGAVRAAHNTSAGRASGVARAALREASVITTMPGPTHQEHAMRRGQRQIEELKRQTLLKLDQITDDVRRSDAQLTKVTGNLHRFLECVRLIPWLTIDRTNDGTSFRVDTHLRAICESLQPRPELSYQSIATYLRTLRDDLTRKRKENRDERQKTRWDSRLILVRIQSDMLDWIEEQLDRMPIR